MCSPPPAQSSAAARLRFRPTVLAVGGVGLVVLVALGLRPGPDPGGTALTPVSTPAAGPIRARPSAPPARPTVATVPVPGPAARREPTAGQRTAGQRAAGLPADGSAFPVPARGSGTFVTARTSRRTSATAGRLVRFDVAVERGLAVDPDQAALLIARVLDDDRSWRGLRLGRFTLVRVGAKADVHAFLATPATTDRLCAPLLTRGRVSCQNGPRVVLNAERWVNGAKAYGDDTAGYRRYLVNHEFGHTLGRSHVGCPGRGRRAPVMMQQTKGLRGCRQNSWPTRTRG